MHVICLMAKEMNAIMKADIKRGIKWFYSNNGTRATIDNARKYKDYKTNCAKMVCWALARAGITESKYTFWGDNGLIRWSSGAEKVYRNQFDIIPGGGKTVNELIKNGTLKAGDIVMYAHKLHTNIYAGKSKWYDAGGAYSKAYGEGVPFKTWHGGMKYGNDTVSFIMRLKPTAKYKKTRYRVKVGPDYTAKATAMKTVNKLIKENYDGPYYVALKKVYRVYAGSYSTKTKAKAIAEEISKKYGLETKVTKVSM